MCRYSRLKFGEKKSAPALMWEEGNEDKEKTSWKQEEEKDNQRIQKKENGVMVGFCAVF